MSDDAPWMRTARAAGLLGADGVARPTIFAEMSAMAARYDAVNLGQGFPDEDAPEPILEAAVTAIRSGVNQYPPGRGTPDLRAAIAEHRQRFRGDTVDPTTEVLVTAGATEALAAALLALVRPGDEVVVLEPTYDAYAALIALAGARMRRIPLRGHDQQPSTADIDAAIGPRTRVVLVNNPHNPTGTLVETALLERIAQRAAENDAIIVADEVYEHLVYDGATFTSMASLPAGRGRTLVVSSAAKTFRVTGWKIGWITGPAALIDAVTAVKQFLTYVNGAPFQPAVAVGLRLGDDYFEGLRDALQRRRDLLSAGLTAAGFTVSPSRGSYFVVADAGPLGVTDGDAFARELVRDVGVASIPLIAFAPGSTDAHIQRSLRFAFCRTDSAVEEAVRRLQRVGGRRL